MTKVGRRYFPILVLLLPCAVVALTRWSTTRFIPDADFIEGSSYVVDYHAYYPLGEGVLTHTAIGHLGLSEWADFQAGYAGGVMLGLKAKILGEVKAPWPSLAVGVHNIRRHREDNYYNHSRRGWGTEYFIVAGKSFDPLLARVHLGLQTMPSSSKEEYTLFGGIEKYLGANAYVSLEAWQRDGMFRPSIFGTMRFLKKQTLEVSGGFVDVLGMILGSSESRVKPGVYLGVRYRGSFTTSSGIFSGFGSLEEQLKYQQVTMKSLRRELDSLKRLNIGADMRMDSLSRTFNTIADSAMGKSTTAKLRMLAQEKIVLISALLGQENLDARKIREARKEVVGHGQFMVPVLKEIVLDNKLESKVHSQAMSLLGRIDHPAAADAVLEIMPQIRDPKVLIEGLIAMRKFKEIRAEYLLRQLALDQNGSVSYTANEVLKELEPLFPEREEEVDTAGLELPVYIEEIKIGAEEEMANAEMDAFIDLPPDEAFLEEEFADEEFVDLSNEMTEQFDSEEGFFDAPATPGEESPAVKNEEKKEKASVENIPSEEASARKPPETKQPAETKARKPADKKPSNTPKS